MKRKQASFPILILHCLLSLTAWTQDETPFTTSFRGEIKPIIGIQSLRQENLYTENTIPFNEDRLRVMGNVSKDWFYLEVANETLFSLQKFNPALFPLPETNTKPFWDTSWKLHESENSVLTTRLDRAFLQASFESVEVRVGKQVVPIGVGHIFSSVSQTPRYPFIVVDPEYDKTEDAITLILKKGVKLEARYLPKNQAQEKDNYHLRWLFDFKNTDAALMAGQSDDKYLMGLEGTRNVGDSVARAEFVFYRKNENNYIQSLLGWDKVWNAKWSSKHELFYNGFGRERDYQLEAFPHRSSNFRGKFYLGNFISYEWSPKLKSNVLLIANLLDPSFLLHLYFNYSLSDNLDLMLGHYENIGSKENSEFGGKQELPMLSSIKAGLPDLTYLLVKWAF